MEIDLSNIVQTYFMEKMYYNVTELCHIMKKSNADKGLGWHNYSTFYEYLFSSIRHEPIRLLEVGCNKKGITLSAWKHYFSNATIINADCEATTDVPEGTFFQVINQRSPNEIHALFKKFGGCDIIIDDGVHRFDENMLLLTNSFQYLNDGGLYII